MNPGLKSLLYSRRFWIMILDLVVSMTLYFVSKYSPSVLEDVKFIILGLQPVFWTIIAALTVENVQQAKIAASAPPAPQPPAETFPSD